MKSRPRWILVTALVFIFAGVFQVAGQKDKEKKKMAPKDVGRIVATGDKLLSEGKTADAGGAYLAVFQEDPANGPVALKLARVYAALEEWENAAKTFDAAAANLTGPVQGEAYAGRASADVQRSKFKEGAEAARKAIELNPAVTSAYTDLAYSLLKLGSVDEALAAARKAIEVSPQSALAQATLGHAVLSRGDVAEAEAAFKKAIELDANSADAYAGLATIQFGKKDYDGTIASATKALDLNSGLTQAYAVRGRAQNEKGNADAAYSDLAMAITVNPEDADSHLAYAQVHKRQGNRDMAINAYRKALEVNPNLKGANLELGELLVIKQDYGGALEALQKAPESAQSALWIGTAYDKQKQFDAALQAYDKAIQLDPNAAAAYHARGKVLREQKKDAAGAVAALEKATSLSPDNPDYQTDLGLALYDSKQVDRSLEVLGKAAATPNYKNAMGFAFLGVGHKDKQNFSNAAEWFEKASAASPTWGLPHWGLAWSYFGLIKKGCPCGPEDQERVAKIKEHYDKAASLGVNDPALGSRVDLLVKGEKLK